MKRKRSAFWHDDGKSLSMQFSNVNVKHDNMEGVTTNNTMSTPNLPLIATYNSPESCETFSHPPSSAQKKGASEVEEKTAYLAQLRANAVKLQNEINVFLTKKMEEDHKLAEEQKGGKDKKNQDEAREEEMYGEEDPEADG